MSFIWMEVLESLIPPSHFARYTGTYAGVSVLQLRGPRINSALMPLDISDITEALLQIHHFMHPSAFHIGMLGNSLWLHILP
jgi:hypothetical protein